MGVKFYQTNLFYNASIYNFWFTNTKKSKFIKKKIGIMVINYVSYT